MKNKLLIYSLITIPVLLFGYIYINYFLDDYRWIFLAIAVFFFYKKMIDFFVFKFKTGILNQELFKFFIPFYSSFRK